MPHTEIKTDIENLYCESRIFVRGKVRGFAQYYPDEEHSEEMYLRFFDMVPSFHVSLFSFHYLLNLGSLFVRGRRSKHLIKEVEQQAKSSGFRKVSLRALSYEKKFWRDHGYRECEETSRQNEFYKEL